MLNKYFCDKVGCWEMYDAHFKNFMENESYRCYSVLCQNKLLIKNIDYYYCYIKK